MPMRTVHWGDGGPKIHHGGWVLRPSHPDTRAKIGDRVHLGTTDPASSLFGQVKFPDSGAIERWTIFNSEQVKR